jgi:NAD-dependent SIR2 family protein deacetylase
MYRETAPHEGFAILKQWADAVPLGAWVFTSNVDGAFQRSGFSQEQIHECHGSIDWLQCMNDCQSELWPSDEFNPEVDAERCHLLNTLPTCPCCGALARPNILMFGDWNWNHARSEEQRSSEKRWLDTLACSGGNVAIIELGAGTAIPSVRHFSHRMSQEYGGRIVRINPREFAVPSSLDVGIPMGSLEALQGIGAAMQVLRANNESKPEGI